jgi:hypothetical protein
MTFLKVIGTAVVLFFGTTTAVYGQKEGKEEPQQRAQQGQSQAQQPQQRAQQANVPAQQPQQRAHQARTPAPQPQQRAQQANVPAQQPQQRAQQANVPAQQPQQRAQQANVPAQQPQQRAQQVRTPAQQPQQRAEANQQQPQRSPQQAQSWQQQRGWASKGGAWQPHTNFQQGRDQNWASDHRDWEQRGGYGGSYIPQASFGIYFGSSHFFHIGVMPVMYMGYPRFYHDGYSFLLVDPWPNTWQENWYANDDVYIDYDGGYYLYDRRYPEVRLAVTVAL